MDTQKFLGTFTNHADLLARAPRMLYAKREIVDGVAQIGFVFTDAPHRHTERFESVSQCDLWWNEFALMMTEMCTPPCIHAGGCVLFQPAYLRRIMCHSDERAHFVILDFGNKHNLWLGSLNRQTQYETYQDLLCVFGLPRDERDQMPPTH